MSVPETVRPHNAALRFGNGNAKLDPAIFTFSLPAGYSCPCAKACLSRANRMTGLLKDGPETEFRCYSASMETRHGSVRRSRWHNFDLLLACSSRREMTQLILDSLTPFAGYVRVHDSGDFFTQEYWDAWLGVAKKRPRTVFYAYTKSLRFWVRRLRTVGNGHAPGKLDNFVLTASYGGRDDRLIERHGLRFSKVVFSEDEARDLGLAIDHDDSHAIRHGPSFALLLHGTQPAGTPAAEAVRDLRDQGEYGYGQRADVIRLKHGRRPLTVLS